jgi:glucose/arabinose dehydrogenase
MEQMLLPLMEGMNDTPDSSRHRTRKAWYRPAPLTLLLIFALAALGAPQTARAVASTVPTGFVDQAMASALNEPVGIAEVPDSPAPAAPRVAFVEQRTGRVQVVVGGNVYLMGTVPNVASADGERGLLGIAFDPAWPARPYLYVHYTDNRSGNHVAISRFTVTGDLSFTGSGSLLFNSATRYDLLKNLPDNAGNHNGGTVRFGPDGALYVSIGDDATRCPAQVLSFMGGKILRLDVTRLPATGTGPPPFAILTPPGNPFSAQADSGARLVWTYGLRNPFRFSMDAGTGALYIADVGEGTWEEMSHVAAGGVNLGWPLFEGPAAFNSCSPAPPSPPVAPIYSYNHSQGAVIISGGLYRRPATGAARFPIEYEGDCFLLDYTSGFMRRLEGSGASWALAPAVPGQPTSTNWGNGFDAVSDVVQMFDGSLWYCRQSVDGAGLSGELRRIAFVQTVAVPVADAAELALQTPQPSPSRGDVTLRWTQPRPERVRLVVFDLSGRSVRTLQHGVLRNAGEHEQVWNGREDSGAAAGPGVYFARLEAGAARRQVRITLLR